MKFVKWNRKNVSFNIALPLLCCILIENMKMFSIGSLSVKGAYLVFAYYILRSINKIKFKNMKYAILYSIIPLFSLYHINDVRSFLSSYCNYLLLAFFYFFAYEKINKIYIGSYRKLVNIFFNIILFTQLLGIVQFILMNTANVFFLRNFWGYFQFESNRFDMQYGLYRAYSIFLEPSFFAWVSNAALAVVLFDDGYATGRNKRNLFIVFDILAVFSSLSSSGIIFMVIIMLTYFLIKFGRNGNGVVCIAFFVVLLLFVGSTTNVLRPLQRIRKETFIENTSGYYRLIAPIQYMCATFKYFPITGRGLGQAGNVDIIGIIGKQQGVHNGVIGLICCFGLNALFYIVPFISFFLKRIRKNRRWLLLFIGIMSIYVSTGAFCVTDTFCFLAMLLMFGNGRAANEEVKSIHRKSADIDYRDIEYRFNFIQEGK